MPWCENDEKKCAIYGVVIAKLPKMYAIYMLGLTPSAISEPSLTPDLSAYASVYSGGVAPPRLNGFIMQTNQGFLRRFMLRIKGADLFNTGKYLEENSD